MAELIFAERPLIAILVALAAAYAMTRHARLMLHQGIGVETGGGWTAVFMCEFMIALAALGVASY
jgi:hypothetical protein